MTYVGKYFSPMILDLVTWVAEFTALQFAGSINMSLVVHYSNNLILEKF